MNIYGCQTGRYNNCTTIIGENVGYFMDKYDIYRDDWNSPMNILYNKIDLYSTQHILIDYICVATSIRDYVSHVIRNTQTS